MWFMFLSANILFFIGMSSWVNANTCSLCKKKSVLFGKDFESWKKSVLAFHSLFFLTQSRYFRKAVSSVWFVQAAAWLSINLPLNLGKTITCIYISHSDKISNPENEVWSVAVHEGMCKANGKLRVRVFKGATTNVECYFSLCLFRGLDNVAWVCSPIEYSSSINS